jgi:hypothetical protein
MKIPSNKSLLDEISGSDGGDEDGCFFLGCCAV